MPDTVVSRTSRKGKAKVKSGCRTCKLRKVKCDESRPACCRCVSTGRVCEGYGIWGGGGNFYEDRGRRPGPNEGAVVIRPTLLTSFLALDMEEAHHFEWFRCRTTIKLPGSFLSDFWSTLLLQASLKEEPVLHAVLALSSIHKGEIINAGRQSGTEDFPHEQYALQHYVKAIKHLEPHLSAKSKESIRIALITCAVFICLDLLRGHFETAQFHLQSGLKILQETEMFLDGGNGTFCLNPCLNPTDDWIVEVFSRLHIQVELFKHAYPHPCLVLRTPMADGSAVIFTSLKEAWRHLTGLTSEVLYLTHQSRQHLPSTWESLRHHLSLLESQQRIQIKLVHWLDIYDASKKSIQDRGVRGYDSADREKVYKLLMVHHTMVSIMVNTCLQLEDEMTYDAHNHQFLLLVEQLTDMWVAFFGAYPVRIPLGHAPEMGHSIIDMGWIPPLYYAAIKCRVHRIRLQAIRLIECTPHREGIWDGKIIGSVARKVMEIEEGDFYNNIDIDDDFPLCSSPSPQELSLPTLPQSNRIREVEVVLSGSPLNTVLLYCKQKRKGIDCRILLSEYDVHLRQWTKTYPATFSNSSKIFLE